MVFGLAHQLDSGTSHSASLAVGMIDMTWLSALLLGAGCLALGYLIGARHSARLFLSPRVSKDTDITSNGKKKNQVKQPLEIEKLADILEDFKMVCCYIFQDRYILYIYIYICTKKKCACIRNLDN